MMADVFTERATFYLADSQFQGLEILMLQLRTGHQVRAGKSELMRLALDRLLASPVENVAREHLKRCAEVRP